MDNATPTVRKGQCETYAVRNGYDAATICVQEWEPRETANGTLYGGVILAHSSFGSYCNAWSACGVPFKHFLLGCEFDYFMSKCLGRDAKEYDGERTLRGVKARIIEVRREGGFSPAQAREAWDCLAHYEIEDSEYCLREATNHHEIGEALGSEWYEFIRMRPTVQSEGFWRDIWPHFVTALKAETATCNGKY